MLLETAVKLLEATKQRAIPVTCDKSKMIGGRMRFSHGTLLGVHKDKLQVRPRNHNTIELYDPALVRVWVSRAVFENILTKEQITEILGR